MNIYFKNMEDYYRFKMNQHFRVKVDGRLVGWSGFKSVFGYNKCVVLLLRALDSKKQVFSWNNRVKFYPK